MSPVSLLLYKLCHNFIIIIITLFNTENCQTAVTTVNI